MLAIPYHLPSMHTGKQYFPDSLQVGWPWDQLWPMECGKSDIFVGLDSENPRKSSLSAFNWSNDAKDLAEDSEALGTAAQPDGRILGP